MLIGIKLSVYLLCFPAAGVPLTLSILATGAVCTFYTALVSAFRLSAIKIKSRAKGIARQTGTTLPHS